MKINIFEDSSLGKKSSTELLNQKVLKDCKTALQRLPILYSQPYSIKDFQIFPSFVNPTGEKW